MAMVRRRHPPLLPNIFAVRQWAVWAALAWARLEHIHILALGPSKDVQEAFGSDAVSLYRTYGELLAYRFLLRAPSTYTLPIHDLVLDIRSLLYNCIDVSFR